ncbi:SHOCT domain-containing protein [Alicyclobacillus sp. ALC3]|uniref:SHOCT domain-containing protein n=1 Tax=Alicyclobacillus sp. ALC3 TaxID=2796143 RepID=UPI00237978E6|nr:SHOCT domain-containing protein [Alicyclobacillus sp. ALC3]WDL98811.1 SHOCT domain-containing protein [Alicyclobacillus sp. ALC3]
MGCGGGGSFIPFPISIPETRLAEQRPSAIDILKMRLARGEITLSTFQQMLAVLDGETIVRPKAPISHIRMP